MITQVQLTNQNYNLRLIKSKQINSDKIHHIVKGISRVGQFELS